MLILNSGTASTPAAGTSNLYLNTSGQFTLKRPAGTTVVVVGQKLQTMPDMIGTFTSGQVPIYDGTNWRPGSAGSAAPASTTINTSGEALVQVQLGSVTIANGTSGWITFSGIDQTYDMLEIRGTMRANANGANQNYVFLNGDTTATNYIARYGTQNANSASLVTTAADAPAMGFSQGFDSIQSNRGLFAPLHFFIQNYAAVAPRKWMYSSAGMPYNYEGTQTSCDQWGVQWETPGVAINMIEIRVNNANTLFCSGTAVQLIGHKRQWVVMSGNIGGTINISHGLLVP